MWVGDFHGLLLSDFNSDEWIFWKNQFFWIFWVDFWFSKLPRNQDETDFTWDDFRAADFYSDKVVFLENSFF